MSPIIIALAEMGVKLSFTSFIVSLGANIIQIIWPRPANRDKLLSIIQFTIMENMSKHYITLNTIS